MNLHIHHMIEVVIKYLIKELIAKIAASQAETEVREQQRSRYAERQDVGLARPFGLKKIISQF